MNDIASFIDEVIEAVEVGAATSNRTQAKPTGPDPTLSAEQPYPAPLGEVAMIGIAGDVVRLVSPQTEADPAAIHLQFLAAFGNLYGSGAYVQIEADHHTPRINVVLVGNTAKARKGTSWGRVRSLLMQTSAVWAGSRIVSGLSSGEGVIYAVRDPVHRIETDKKTGAKTTVTVDEGEEDKRLLVYEGEFAKALRAMERNGNTLSSILRDAWDHGNLRTLIKNDANLATGAHISLVSHITAEELRRYLDRTELANGLANRMIFACVHRSQLLPRGGELVDWTPIVERLNKVLSTKHTGPVHFTDEAWTLWDQEYPKLSAEVPGLLGAVVARAEAQVIRLSLVYALLDRSVFIELWHLKAALECWRYAADSARYIFGDSLGDPVADEILRALRDAPEGLTRLDLFNHFQKNRSSAEITRSLELLAKGRFVFSRKETTGGRPAERWCLMQKAAAS